MSSKQPDVGRNDAKWADLRRKLIVRPTLAGFGTVVADCATCDPSLDYVGCIVVNLTPEYALKYVCGVGHEVAYISRYHDWGTRTVHGLMQGKITYHTADPGTQGT